MMADPGLLADLCSATVKLGCALPAERAADAETLVGRFERAFADLESRALGAGVPEAHVRAAIYALCAWIDERVLLSELPARRAWAANPLQLRRFDDLAAGDEFYARLEALRASTEPGAADALEVYALCLALGFRGKLAQAPPERRRLLLDQLAAEIARARCVAPPLHIHPSRAAASGPGAACWLAPLLAIVGLVACYGLAHAWSERAVDALAASVAEVPHGP